MGSKVLIMTYSIILRVAHTSFVTRSDILYENKEVAEGVKIGLNSKFGPKHIFWVQKF